MTGVRMKAILLLAVSFVSHGALAAKTERATLIVVDKSDHLMQVYAKDKIIATYRVGFGTNPLGHKQQEGDKRTPEGRYMLDYKNANSTFFKSIHISYPNKADKAEAKRLGVRPGGDIMIHGQANDPVVRAAIDRYPYPDWTYGCISMKNEDMQRLWDMVAVPTPIHIRP
jgi:murein L,D-transpeptidase YafK